MRIKRIQAILLSIAMVIAMLPGAAFADTSETEATSTATFVDMPQDWSTQALENAVSNMLISGYDENGQKFIKPQGNLTRAELATIVNSAFGAENTASLSGIADVSSGSWFAPEIAKALQMKTLSYDTQMRPNDSVTRQETATILARAFNMQCTDSNHAALKVFSDAGSVASWAEDNVCALVEGGYLAGANGQINPTANITRAEFAKMMDNIVAQYITAAGTYSTVAANGNVMINTAAVVLKDVTVNGDLIIGDGVGNGDVTLDSVKVTGKVIARGGGKNSITITGNSDIGEIVVSKVDGAIRVFVDGKEVNVKAITVDDGKNDVIIEGTVGTVTVAGEGIKVVANNATISQMNMTGKNSTASVSASSTVAKLTVAEAATGATTDISGTVTTLQVSAPDTQINAAATAKITTVDLKDTATGTDVKADKGASITTVATAANGVAISGEGTIKNADVSGNNTKIDTTGTTVKVATGTTGTSSGGTAIAAGSTVTTTASGTTTTGGSGGGSSGGTTSTSTSVNSITELTAALANTKYTEIVIASDIGSSTDYSIITVDRAVTIKGSQGKTFYGSFVVTADGVTFDNLTIQNQGEVPNGAAHKNAINFYGKKITINKCEFISGSQFANGVVIFPSDSNVDLAITSNTFKGYANATNEFNTSGLIITLGYDMSQKGFFEKTGLSAASIGLDVDKERAIITGNTFEDCSVDYSRSAWVGQNYVEYCTAFSNGILDNLSYAAEAGAMYYVSGDLTLDANANTIQENTKVIILEGASLTIETGKTLTVEEGATLSVEEGGILSVAAGANLSVAAGANLSAKVTSIEGLKAALANTGYTEIVIDGTIGGTVGPYNIFEVTEAVTIKGIGTGPTVIGSFVVTADGVTFKDLTVKNTYSQDNQSASKNAINFYGAKITITDCIFENVGANSDANGVFIFPSSSTVDYTIKGNTFENYGSNAGDFYGAGLGIAENFPMDQKSFLGQSGKAANDIDVNDSMLVSNNTFDGCAYGYARQYWENDWPKYHNVYVSIYDADLLAIDLPLTLDDGTIVIGENLSVASALFITNDITIDGNGFTLTFNNAGTALPVTGTDNDCLVFMSDVEATLKNITIQQTKSPAVADAWLNAYVIHVYEATVTLEDVTATGGDAGILVNSSDVTLEGTIDVGGNTFGGIELTKGAASSYNPSLNIVGATIINGSEADDHPTIWVDQASAYTLNGSGSLTEYENITKVQIWFFLNETNSPGYITP